ncbi:hypothetical protein [Cardinium endosymbiont of Nabis limbatus]|uniref:hypothetical protein n=1 Tax=Cardinium endosymbiont of Nabis limbatus TaxID=3066217 RepID=UPI003AF3CBA7
MKSSWLFSPNKKGMAISIGLHLFFLGLACSIQHIPAPGVSSGATYRIALQPTSMYTVSKDRPSNDRPQPQIQGRRLDATQMDQPSSKHPLKNKRLVPKKQRQKQPRGLRAQPKTAQPPKVAKIDERGLYNRGKNPTKQTGATLELRGWEWDTVPDPKDGTEEFGKIVFEIKVDKNGEIISIQAIEKTVTPMVEKIYADALRALTFTRTTDTPSGISTGKVTFVIVAKQQ